MGPRFDAIVEADGVLSFAEWDGLRGEAGEGLMRYVAVDENGDGSVSHAEFTSTGQGGGGKGGGVGGRRH